VGDIRTPKDVRTIEQWHKRVSLPNPNLYFDYTNLMNIVQKRYLASLVLLLLLASSSSFMVSTYGHGLGQDQAPPVTIQGKRVTVEGVIGPSFLPLSNSSKPTLVIRAHDENNNITIAGIDYRIAVELRNETLLDQRFRSSDGVIKANLIPDGDIEGWEINGQAMPREQQQIEVSQSNPVELRSKILTEGGLYHFMVIIEKSSPGVSVQADQKFDLYISVGRAYTFDVSTPQAQEQMVVKTYYDDIMNFNYSNKTISFETPFTWDRAYVEQVPVLHMEVQFPKTLEELQTNSYRGTLNGRELEAQAVVIDDYTSEQNRIVHFIVSNAMLSRFSQSTNDSDIAAFTLRPSEKPKFPLDLTSLPGEKFLFQLSWGPDIIETGTPITFVMNIQDPKTGDLVRGASFDFVLTQDGSEIHQKHIVMDFGTYSYQYTFSKAGTVTLAANNINGQGESAKIDLGVLQGSGNTTNQLPQPTQSQCLIATAAFGSELTPQVNYLRFFRDQYILSTASGLAFMNTFNSVYYSFSPQVAEYERGQPWLQGVVKIALYPLFGILATAEKGYAVLGGEAGSILAGTIASSLIGAVYLWPVGLAASRRVRSISLVVIMGVTAGTMAVTLVAFPTMLPFSTAGFVVAVAGASAIAIAKAIRHFFLSMNIN
jgi:peptide/nickel transport system substrate-binding protein